jgi:hypothetical protein
LLCCILTSVCIFSFAGCNKGSNPRIELALKEADAVYTRTEDIANLLKFRVVNADKEIDSEWLPLPSRNVTGYSIADNKLYVTATVTVRNVKCTAKIDIPIQETVLTVDEILTQNTNKNYMLSGIVVSFGTTVDFHGIQCAIGTRYTAKIYEQIKKLTPDVKKACDYAQSFDLEKWNEELRSFVGDGAEAMIALEKKEGKYDVQKHRERIAFIAENWDKILKIIDEELPTLKKIEEILDTIEAPKTAAEIGIDEAIVPMTFKASKDIRDKYVLPRLAWDLGVIDELEF